MVKQLLKSILILLLISIGWNAYGQNPRILTTGTTFTVPANTKVMKVEAWGGGGSGGNDRGAGGGGGAYARSSITGPFAASYPYVVGSGGNNSAGGLTTFGSGPALVSAGGGGKGGDNSGASGTGGTATIGNESIISGLDGYTRSGNSGGDGGNAGNTANGGGTGGAGAGGAGSPGNPSGGGGGGSGNGNNTRPIGGLGQIRISYIALTSATNTDAQTVCTGTAITTITYSAPTGSPTVNITNLPTGVTSSYNSGTGIISITGNPTTTSIYTISVTTSYGVSLTTTGTITRTPNQTVAAASSAPTVCINTALATSISHATTNATGIGTATGLPAGVTASWSANTITIVGTPSVSGTFNYSIPVQGCLSSGVNATGTITVTANQTVASASSAPTVCINTALAASITHATTNATGIGAPTGLPAGVTASWSANTITIVGTPSVSGTFNYSIPVQGCLSSGVNATGTITVTANQTVASASSAPTVCINTALAASITHATTNATGIGAPTGLPAGVTASWSANTITIVGTPSVSGTFNYSIPVQGCLSSGVNATGTITVTPNQTVAAASSAPTLCVNSPLAASITHATTNATGIGAPTGLPAGVTASWSANTITIVGTPSVSGTFNYSIPVQGCLSSGVNATGTITVTPNQTVAAASSAPTLCVNSPLATSITHATTNATGIGAPTGLPTGVTASWSANTITILGTPSVSGTFNYSIPVQGCLSSGVNATGTITVNPATSIDSENLVAQSACFGQTSFSPISVTASGTGTLFYQWYSNTNPLNSGGSPIGTDSPTYTPDASTIGTLYYYVVVNSDCGPVATSNISGAFIVDHITAITTQPDTSDRVECFGDGFNPLSVTAVGGDLTYQWYSNSTQTNTGGTAIPGAGATSATFTPPSTTEGISYYYVVVTGNCGTETSTVSGEFRVNPPKTVIDTSPSTSNESKCLGEAFPTLSVLASGEGSVSYQWYKNTTASNSGGTLISGAISEDYTPLSDEIGTFYYYALASSNCGTVPTEVSGSFTVYAPPTVTNPATASICSGASPNISLTASVPSSFSWTIGTITGGITGASAGSGATINQTLTNPSNATAGTVEFIVTPTSTTGSCPGAPYSITVTVNPTPAVTNPATAITCSGTGPNISLTASAPSSFSWTIGTITGGITGASAGSGATINQTLTNPTNTTTGTVQYIVTPTATTGSCPGAPYTITVTVNPLPTVTNSTLSQTICSGGSTTAVTLNSGIAGTSFAWTASATAGVSGFTASGSGPIPIETISTTGTTQGTVTYVITPTVNGCPGPTKNYSVLVNPQPTVTNSTLSQTICSGGSTTAVTPTSGVAGTTFTWTASATAGVSGFTASGSGPIPIQTITTTGTTQGTVTYIITPTANGCPGPTKNYTVLVNPLATVSAPSVAFPSVCISSPALTPFTQTTSGVTAIDRPGVPGVNGLPPGISATFSGNTITFSGTATTTGLYSYSIPLTGTCVTGPATGTIDVTPNYQLSSVSSVSATSAGGTATVTVNADPLLVTNGTYQVQYQIAQGVGSFGPITTSSNFTINNGRGSYGITPINSLTDTYTVQIVSIRKITDACWVDLSASPPTTYFGACSAVFTTNTTFYVPPNIYSVTIQVYGGGGGGENGAGKKGGGGGGYSTRTISVTPGEAIAVYVGAGGSKEVNGGTSYVTRDSNIANQIGNSLLYAEGGISGAGNANGGKTDSRYPGGSNGADGTISTGGNAGGPLGSTIGKGGDSNNSGNKGQIRISYSCPDANKTDCVEYVDDGATTGTTIIRYICDGVWNAPEGLTDFSVLVGGAGGGGGSGNGGGGGGAGSLVTQSYSISNPYGMPAGSNYTITTGIGGVGSTGVNIKGANGSSSSFTGSVNGSSITMTAIGGGGGASASTGNYVGNIGAAGGGGAANSGSKGNGGTPNSAGSTGGLVYAGGAGGNGENNQQTAIAGGGGGGINTDPALAIGQNGKAAGQGQGEGGNGGQGASINFGGTIINYGAGGGGIGALFNGTDKIGIGGIAGGQKLGGDGNLIVTANGGVGYPGVPYSGSGGGAGYNGGGKGGNGVVYISFFNYRILEVSYLYFKAEYNPDNRTGELTWATSQEWENDRFEIERATSNDLTSWTKIGEVTGQGYSDSPTEYKFEDTNLPAAGGNILYRLKQIDVDGSFAYSVTRSIQVKGLKGQSTWVVYPNPSSPGNYVTVDLLDRGSFRDEQIHIKISDVKGVFNSYSVRSVEEVSLVVNDYLEKAAPGVHIVQLIWGPQSEQLKILRR